MDTNSQVPVKQEILLSATFVKAYMLNVFIQNTLFHKFITKVTFIIAFLNVKY